MEMERGKQIQETKDIKFPGPADIVASGVRETNFWLIQLCRVVYLNRKHKLVLYLNVEFLYSEDINK